MQEADNTFRGFQTNMAVLEKLINSSEMGKKPWVLGLQ